MNPKCVRIVFGGNVQRFPLCTFGLISWRQSYYPRKRSYKENDKGCMCATERLNRRAWPFPTYVGVFDWRLVEPSYPAMKYFGLLYWCPCGWLPNQGSVRRHNLLLQWPYALRRRSGFSHARNCDYVTWAWYFKLAIGTVWYRVESSQRGSPRQYVTVTV